MGSTFIRFRNSGFEANDACMEIWLHLLVNVIDRQENKSLWLQEVREEWQLMSTANLGYVMPGLDEFVTDEEKRQFVLSLSKAAMHDLEQYGEQITALELNAMGTPGSYNKDVPSEAFKRVGRYFIKLLQGDLGPDETDTRMYEQHNQANKDNTNDTEN